MAMKSSLSIGLLEICLARPLLLCLGVLFVDGAHASKVYIALMPTNTPFHAVVTVMEKPCSTNEGNALYLFGKSASMGCWRLDGQQVRVDWQTGSNAPTVFEFDKFKLVSDEVDSDTSPSSSKQ